MLKRYRISIILLSSIAGEKSAQASYKCLIDLAGENHENSVTVADIMDTPFIVNPDTLMKYRGLSVYRFSVFCTKNKDLELKQANSNRLSTEQFNAIGFADVGNKIYIVNIVISCADGTLRKLSPLTFTIKGR